MPPVPKPDRVDASGDARAGLRSSLAPLDVRSKHPGDCSFSDLPAAQQLQIARGSEESLEEAGCRFDALESDAFRWEVMIAAERCDGSLQTERERIDASVDPETVRAFEALVASQRDLLSPLNWPEFWAGELEREDWLIEPIVAAQRQTAIYSKAKTGKSLLSLDLAAAAATGRSALGYPAKDPQNVCYVDQEMTGADLRERLDALGYGPGDDLSRLHYYLLPSLPPLDTERGGEVLCQEAVRCEASVVILDTMSRVVQGEENSADTYRNFFRWTGRRLKAAGIAVLRLDHQGKDSSLGQRGSSAKVDDPDVVFRLSQVSGNSFQLLRTHSRVPWVPETVRIVRDEQPHLRHYHDDQAIPAGAHKAMLKLDEVGVPLDATGSQAVEALRRADRGARKADVLAAVKARREAAHGGCSGSGTVLPSTDRNH